MRGLRAGAALEDSCPAPTPTATFISTTMPVFFRGNSGPGGKGLVQGLPASFLPTKCGLSGPEGALQSGEWTPLLVQGAQARSSRHIRETSRQWTQEFEKVPRGRKNQKKKGRK